MKRIALILCATASLFSGANAMDTAQQEVGIRQEIPVKVFNVNTVPPVQIIQIPSERQVILDGGMIAPSIDLACRSYNGIEVKGPIKLSYDMTKEQLTAALIASFGADKQIQFFEGILSRR